MTAKRSAKLASLEGVVLGAILCGTIFMWVVAAGNFSILDATNRPKLGELLGPSGPENTRFALRHGASELNRFYFLVWNRLQVGLLVLFLVLEWMRSRGQELARMGGGVSMLVLGLVLLLYLTPLLTEAGRAIDFVPTSPESKGRAAFMRVHAVYMAVDFLKFLCGILLVALTARDDRSPPP